MGVCCCSLSGTRYCLYCNNNMLVLPYREDKNKGSYVKSVPSKSMVYTYTSSSE